MNANSLKNLNESLYHHFQIEEDYFIQILCASLNLFESNYYSI